MDRSERANVRRAAEKVEAAHSDVAELLATGDVTLKRVECNLGPAEKAALQEANASLREACERLWGLYEAAAAND